MRCYNPPRLDEPLGWLSRDHRKCLVVDGEIAFVTGLCVGQAVGGRSRAAASRPGATPASRCAAPRWPTWRAPSPTPGRPAGAPAAARRARRPARARRPRATWRCAWWRRRRAPPGSTASTQLVASLARRTPVAHRRLLRGHHHLRAGAARGRAGRRRRAAARARPRQRHPAHAGHLPRRLSRAARGRACASSSGTGRCSTPRPRWPTRAGRGWAPPTSTSRAGSATASSTWWSRTRPSAARMEEMFLEDLANATEIVLKRGARASGGRRRDPAHPPSRGQRDPRGRRRAAHRQRARCRALAERLHGPAERRLMVPTGLGLVALAPSRSSGPGARLAARRVRALAGRRAADPGRPRGVAVARGGAVTDARVRLR